MNQRDLQKSASELRKLQSLCRTIAGLSKERGYCWAGNDRLGRIEGGVSAKTIQRRVKRLMDLKLISGSYIRRQGGVERRLSLLDNGLLIQDWTPEYFAHYAIHNGQSDHHNGQDVHSAMDMVTATMDRVSRYLDIYSYSGDIRDPEAESTAETGTDRQTGAGQKTLVIQTDFQKQRPGILASPGISGADAKEDPDPSHGGIASDPGYDTNHPPVPGYPPEGERTRRILRNIHKSAREMSDEEAGEVWDYLEARAAVTG